MRSVRRAAWAVSDAYQECFSAECDGAHPAACPIHGALVAERKLAQQIEVDKLRTTFLAAFDASRAVP